MNLNVEAKRLVAKIAASLVSHGDSLLVDTGTTTFEFVRCLFDKRSITIVTSDLSIATFADSNLPHAEVLMLGGALRKNHRYITGPITNETLSRIHVDKAFIACDSFHPDFGFTTEYMGNAEVKRQMLVQARESFMIMDATKVCEPSFIKFAGISDFTAVVSDYDLSGIFDQAIRAAGSATQLLVTGDNEHNVDYVPNITQRIPNPVIGLVGRQTSEHI